MHILLTQFRQSIRRCCAPDCPFSLGTPASAARGSSRSSSSSGAAGVAQQCSWGTDVAHCSPPWPDVRQQNAPRVSQKVCVRDTPQQQRMALHVQTAHSSRRSSSSAAAASPIDRSIHSLSVPAVQKKRSKGNPRTIPFLVVLNPTPSGCVQSVCAWVNAPRRSRSLYQQALAAAVFFFHHHFMHEKKVESKSCQRNLPDPTVLLSSPLTSRETVP